MINDKKIDYKLVNIAVLALIVYLMYHTGNLWIGMFNNIISIILPFLIGFGVSYSVYPIVQKPRKRNWPTGLAIFTVIGIICAVTGSVFASALGGYFTLIMASLLLVIGLKIVEVLDFEIPVIIKSMPQNKTNSLVLYPLLLGIAFALAGTPCSTPILAGIMVFAAMGKNLLASTIMLFLFAIGQGLILILAGIFTSTVKNIKKFSNITDKIVKISGWLIIFVSIYLYCKVFLPLI